jgi:hypothetical protein
MTTYQDVWNTMNELDMMTSKIGYIREMVETASEYMGKRDYTRAESLMDISSDYIKYFLEEYDRTFQLAWSATTNAGKELDDVRAKLSRLENPDNPNYTDEEMEAMTNQETYDQ